MIPLLEGRVRDGVVTSEVVSPPVSGVVIEIGAGSGMWADIFSKINTGGSATAATAVSGDDNDSVSGVRRRMAGSGITKIYGVEPNPESVKALRQRVKDLGLDDIYEVMPVGIESLDDPNAWPGKHIEPGSVDSIVTILCLCSIPDQEANVKALYKLLKPGGRWYVFEHVKATRGGPLMKLYQRECFRAVHEIGRGAYLRLHGHHHFGSVARLTRIRFCQSGLVLVHRIVSPVLRYSHEPEESRSVDRDEYFSASSRATLQGPSSHLRHFEEVNI